MVNEGTSGPMNVDTKNGSKEIRINYPSEFDGNRENLENFPPRLSTVLGNQQRNLQHGHEENHLHVILHEERNRLSPGKKPGLKKN